MLYIFAVGIFFSMGCNESDDSFSTIPSGLSSVWIINEGNYGTNNASITLLDTLFEDTTFSNATGSYLNGSAVHSAVFTDSTTWLMMTGSDKISILHRRTLKAMRTITGIKSPRNGVLYQNNVYVTSYFDSLVIAYNAADYTETNRYKLSHRPDEITALNGLLIVSNSRSPDGVLSKDSVISLIDITMSDVNAYVIGSPVVSVCANNPAGKVYIAYTGKSSSAGKIVEWDPLTKVITSEVVSGINPTFVRMHDSVLVYNTRSNSAIIRYDMKTDIKITLAGSYFVGAPLGEDILAADAQDFLRNGYLYWIRKDGTIRKRYPVGITPSSILQP
ncbi:MAG TPA: hypothetical protein PKJ64_07285 [bacterium]|nr:hypothetical protein [bacterium]HMZ03676.1 hypothetical protein [bacterium]HND76061.1 hypothetical protein [bacterium]HNF86154.1 hypothetical protein [bacterium]HNJ71642.1 hypothetical protein [bacterium]